MKDWLVFLTYKDPRIRYMYFVKQAPDNLRACLVAWEKFEEQFYQASRDQDAWALVAYELPEQSGAHRIDH